MLFKRKRLKFWAISIVSAIAIFMFSVLQAKYIAEEVNGVNSSYMPPTTEQEVNGESVTVPDWMRITFDSLPPIQEGGEVVVPQEVVKALGYDPSRSWEAGQEAATYLMMGDFADSFRLQDFAIKNIADIVGLDLSQANLQDYDFVSWQTGASLAQAIPGLEDLPIERVKPLYDLFTQEGVGFSQNAKIGQLLQQYEFMQDIPLSNLEDSLANYDLESIPGLQETSIDKYENWQRSSIDKIPGMKYVPFGLFPLVYGNIGYSVLGKADVVFSKAEEGDPKTPGYFITGGANKGTARKPEINPKDCKPGDECSYIELEDLFGIGDALHGKRWGSGETQQTRGGYGILTVVNAGKEPTGMLPFGPGFKVVMTGANESEGQADFGIYFRACMETIFTGYTCTPYFIGPVPWFPIKEKDAIIILSTERTIQTNIPENYQREIADILATTTGNVNPSCEGECVEGDEVSTGTFTHPTGQGSRVSSPYGWRRRPISGKMQFHKGIDYAVPMGTPVKSVDGGTVIRVSNNNCADYGDSNAKRNCGGQLGNWIDVRHGDGKIVRYGHLQQGSISVAEGTKVSRGQVIAGVGSSGWSTGAHLDLRVHDGNGNYENPDNYITR